MTLTPIATNLWTTAQPLRFLGLEVGARMSVVRLSDGELVLISPVSLTEGLGDRLDELGTVAHIIAPNLFHHLFMGQAQARYPQAKVWGVEGLAEKRPDLKLDALLNAAGSFAGDLDYLPFKGFEVILPRGIAAVNETVFFHRPSRTLILTDIAFNFDDSSSLGTQLAARVLGSYNSLKPTLLEKWGTRDRVKVEASVWQVLAWDFERVVPAHGSVINVGGKAAFQAGYEWFLNQKL